MFSIKIDPSTYDTEGLCEGIDVRQTLYTELEWLGAIRAHEDWSKHISPVKHYKGTLGPRFSFVGVTLPDCIPERLEVLCYACEFAVMHDDIADTAEQNISASENDKVLDAYHELLRHEGSATSTSDIEVYQAGGKKRIQAEIVQRMFAIDREATHVTISAWSKFLTAGSGRRHKPFETLDDYLPYRVKDIGEMFWFGVVSFGLGLRIPDSEMALLSQLTRPAWIAVSLTNDLFSWEKESEEATTSGKHYVVNAIWILMHQHSISIADAKAKCCNLIKKYVAEFLQNLSQVEADPTLSKDLQTYIDSMKYKISGNIVWSLTCPRYNSHVCFNEQQLRWMEEGINETNRPLYQHDLELGTRNSSTNGCTTNSRSVREFGSTQSSSQSQNSSSPSKTDTFPSPLECPQATLLKQATASVLSRHLPSLDAKIASAPIDYLSTLPSKGIRSLLIDALNHWLRAPSQVVETIKTVVDLLHNSSLLLDDIQDGSTLRRGMPAAHTIFGSGQSINSSSHSIIRALMLIEKNLGSECVRFTLANLDALFIGQAYDLQFTHINHCPSVEEYIRMIDHKTGGLFGLSSDLVQAVATENSTVNFRDLSVLFGRYFQIRDDYQNLMSGDYADQKGFCEDLDEGKYSLPMIHMCQTDTQNLLVQNIRATSKLGAGLTKQHKMMVLNRLKQAGSFDFTLSILDELSQEIDREIQILEGLCGRENSFLRALWMQIKL